MTATTAPRSSWARRGPLLVLPRWPADVEVLAARLLDPEDAAAEIARIEGKRGVTAADVEALRRIVAGAAA